MSRTNKPIINYTSRDFRTIKSDLVEYAKTYYPTTFKDFQEAGFGSLMLDNVAYIGDILSFYLDYQFNESFSETALEFRNLNRIARQAGIKFIPNKVATGIISFFVEVPASTTTGGNLADIGPDTNYLPILKKNSVFATSNNKVYTLVEDVDFSNPNFQVVVNKVNSSTGAPTAFIIKGFGKVLSGRVNSITKTVGDFRAFYSTTLPINNATEIISVTDSNGNEYYEVDYLSQDVVYRSVPNRGPDSIHVPFILKPVGAARRFETVFEDGVVRLQFGYGSEAELDTDGDVVDPSLVLLNQYGKDYLSDPSFDPKRLLSSGRMGVSPANTTLTIRYRANEGGNLNAGVGTITRVVKSNFSFRNRDTLLSSLISSVRNSLEVTNEEPVMGDARLLATDELRILTRASHASQNRAVTGEDYKALIYTMPANFGAIKRVAVYKDNKAFKNNLNIYLMSEDSSSRLLAPSTTLRENVKNYIQNYKMIGDSIDIFNASVINVGFNIVLITEPQVEKLKVRRDVLTKLKNYIATKPQIGENIIISEFTNIINEVPGVADVLRFKVVRKTGDNYFTTRFSVMDNTSADGNTIFIPKNAIYEVRFPNTDISLEVR